MENQEQHLTDPAPETGKKPFLANVPTWLLASGLAIAAVALAVLIYFVFFQKIAPVEVMKKIDNSAMNDKSDASDMISSDISDWQTYRNEDLGIEFKYPLDWSFNNAKSNVPNITIATVYINDLPAVCELGYCQPTVNEWKKLLAEEKMENQIDFTGGTGFIRIFDTTEGGPPISPVYQLIVPTKESVITMTVQDYSMVCESSDECYAYTQEIKSSAKTNNSKYLIYDRFIDLIEKTFKIYSNWQTYRNEELGIEFQYPDDYIIDTIKYVVYLKNDNYVWTLDYFQGDGNGIDVWFDNYFDKNLNKDCIKSDSNIKIGDYDMRLISAGSMEDKCDAGGYYMMSNDKLKVIKINFGQDPKQSLFDILNTFKFIK